MLEDLVQSPQTELQYGIKPTEFLAACKKLEEKFNIKFDYKPFNVEIKSGSAKYHIPSHYISFLYYCLALERDDVDIRYLVQQFRKAQEQKHAETIIHASSIAVLAYIYHRRNQTIEFLPEKNGGDFKINGLVAELKTFQAAIFNNRSQNFIKIKDGRVDVNNTIYSWIEWINNRRLQEAIKQGEIIFFNCNELPFFSELGLFNNNIENIVEPKRCRVVYYFTRHFDPGGELFLSDSEGHQKSFGITKAPDLDRFFGVCIDIDPTQWRGSSQN